MPKTLVFLQNDQDFSQFRQSKQVVSPNFRLKFRYNTNQNFPRFGFIIPKKVVAKVTDRNKIKRRLKTVLLANIKAIKPAEYLFFPHKSCLKTDFQSFQTEVVMLFQKAKLWNS